MGVTLSGVPSPGSRTTPAGADHGPHPAEAQHVLANRRAWDRLAGPHEVPETERLTWGWWRWTEHELQILGDIAGKAVLDLGCGAARWTVALARHGASPVGIDSSPRQLEQARRVVRQAGLELPLVLADAEQLPFADESFDVVACDWGATSFTDPYRSVPEAARVLRPGGLLTFSISSPLGWLCSPQAGGIYTPGTTLQRSYFDLRRWQTPDGLVHFQLPYGAWIRLFRDNSMVVEDLVEPPAPDGPIPRYLDEQCRSWAEQWPFECIWKARRG